jgi:hypothetical protein
MDSRRVLSGIVLSVSLCAIACTGEPAGSTEKEESAVTVAKLPTPLGSFSNYVMGNNDCSLLKDIVVTVEIKEPLVVSSSSPEPGFGFQLNTNSTVGSGVVWQQYFIRVHDDFIDEINNWTSAALPTGIPTVDWQVPYTLPGFPEPTAPTTTLPAGYKLKFDLINDEAGLITQCNFTVSDGKGHSKTEKVPLVKRAGANTASLAPIGAFQMDLVGPTGGNPSSFASGAGTITYSSSTSFHALSAIPGKCAGTTQTGESSNSIYGPMPSGSMKSVEQAFAIPVPLCLIPECNYNVCCPGGTCLSEPTDLSNLNTICCDGNACNTVCCPADTPCSDVKTSTCGSKCEDGKVPTPNILASGSSGVHQTCETPPSLPPPT